MPIYYNQNLVRLDGSGLREARLNQETYFSISWARVSNSPQVLDETQIDVELKHFSTDKRSKMQIQTWREPHKTVKHCELVFYLVTSEPPVERNQLLGSVYIDVLCNQQRVPNCPFDARLLSATPGASGAPLDRELLLQRVVPETEPEEAGVKPRKITEQPFAPAPDAFQVTATHFEASGAGLTSALTLRCAGFKVRFLLDKVRSERHAHYTRLGLSDERAPIDDAALFEQVVAQVVYADDGQPVRLEAGGMFELCKHFEYWPTRHGLVSVSLSYRSHSIGLYRVPVLQPPPNEFQTPAVEQPKHAGTRQLTSAPVQQQKQASPLEPPPSPGVAHSRFLSLSFHFYCVLTRCLAGVWTQCRKVTVQNGRTAEMEYAYCS